MQWILKYIKAEISSIYMLWNIYLKMKDEGRTAIYNSDCRKQRDKPLKQHLLFRTRYPMSCYFWNTVQINRIHTTRTWIKANYYKVHDLHTKLMRLSVTNHFHGHFLKFLNVSYIKIHYSSQPTHVHISPYWAQDPELLNLPIMITI